MSVLPRVSAFPILPEGHMLYKVSGAMSLPSKERFSSPLLGKQAPEIILKDQLGRDCSLHATIALGRPIVLFFFPLAGSPHCTLESCYFRDALAESAVFTDLDAIIIGVSQDSPEILNRFAAKHDLGYIILSDHERVAMQTFGVTRTWMGLINSRSTFIIDPNGIVRAQCDGVLAAAGHRQFAERWLIRIEHELVGREKTLEDVEVDGDGDGDEDADAEALDDPSKVTAAGQRHNYRVVLGAENSAKGAGVDKAPRHGAAPLPPMPHVKRATSGLRGLIQRKPLAGHSTEDLRHYDGSTRRPGSDSSSHDGQSAPRPRSASFKASKRSLRKVFTRKDTTLPPIPPTYQNLDEGIVQVGGHETTLDMGAYSDGQSVVSSASGSLSHNNSSSHAHGSSAGGGDVGGAHLIPLRPGESDVYTPVSHNVRRIPVPTVEYDDEEERAASQAPTDPSSSSTTVLPSGSLTRPRRPSTAPAPAPAPQPAQPSPSPSPSPSMGVLSPRELVGSPHFSVLSPSSMGSPQIGSRTTSRRQPQPWSSSSSSSSSTPSASRPSTSGGAAGGGGGGGGIVGRSSLDTVRVAAGEQAGGSSGGGGSSSNGTRGPMKGAQFSTSTSTNGVNGRSTPLSPAPPAIRSKRSGLSAPLMAAGGSRDSHELRRSTSTSTSTSTTGTTSRAGTPTTPTERGSIESVNVVDAQVQAVKRLVIHRDPVSPQRVDSIRVRRAGGGGASPSGSASASASVTASPSASVTASPDVGGAGGEGQFETTGKAMAAAAAAAAAATATASPPSAAAATANTESLPTPPHSPSTSTTSSRRRSIPRQVPAPSYAPPPPPPAATSAETAAGISSTNGNTPTTNITSPTSPTTSHTSHRRGSVQSHNSGYSYDDGDEHDGDDASSIMTTSTTTKDGGAPGGRAAPGTVYARRPSAASSILSTASHDTTGTFGL